MEAAKENVEVHLSPEDKEVFDILDGIDEQYDRFLEVTQMGTAFLDAYRDAQAPPQPPSLEIPATTTTPVWLDPSPPTA